MEWLLISTNTYSYFLVFFFCLCFICLILENNSYRLIKSLKITLIFEINKVLWVFRICCCHYKFYHRRLQVKNDCYVKWKITKQQKKSFVISMENSRPCKIIWMTSAIYLEIIISLCYNIFSLGNSQMTAKIRQKKKLNCKKKERERNTM